ncbi:MAG TPA: hypothetical protein VGL23_10750 [Chloroflexota bacterium]|jgi:hypothetical protein
MTTALSDCLALAAWLEATRAADGFGGPVAHWWRDCLVDCRPGHDWRYEGIVAGYLSLYAATGDEAWLARAGRAGDDVVAAQAPDGHYNRSQFEMNPGTAGTPHETGASIALLLLGRALSSRDLDASHRYARAAERNLRAQIDALWSPESATLRDHAERDSFVPNKACTFVEAMLLLADATGSDRWVEEYALPIAEMVLAHQIRRPGSHLDGAIAQNSVGRQIVPKYFPYYVARCIPGLLALRQHDPDGRFADAALAAGRFVAAAVEPDGAWPQVLYEDGRLIRFPRWVAGAGDVVRALELLVPLGQRADTAASRAWIAAGRLPNGAVRTADGFAAQGTSTLRPGPPDLRDFLPVAGWADKTLRLWAGDPLAAGPAAGAAGPFEAVCVFLGRRLELRLDGASVDVRQRGRSVYRWRAGEPWAELGEPWMAAR